MTQDQITEFLVSHPTEWGGSTAKQEFQRLDKEQRFSVLNAARSRYGEMLRSGVDFPQPPPGSLTEWLLSEAL